MAPKRARLDMPLIDPISDGVILTKPEHIDNYHRLASSTSLCTSYFDDKMLDTLGLREGVEYMAEQIGWTKFLKMKEPAYRSLTFEFLSTLEVVGPAKDRMVFRLGNQDRELTLAQLNVIFGFKTGGCRRETGPTNVKFDPDWEWDFIAETRMNRDYDPRISRACDIYSPCIRLMHRFVAQTIFGRELPKDEDKNTVRQGELLFLWAMLYKDRLKLINVHLERVKIDTGYFLVNHLQKASTKGNPNVIFAGGIITSIAKYFKIRLYTLRPMDISWINIETCMKDMDMVFKRHGQYYLRVPCMINHNSRECPLPDVSLTDVQNSYNWKCAFLDKGDYYDWYDSDKSDSGDDEVQTDYRGCEEEEDAFGSIAATTSGPSTLESILSRVENIERQLQRLNNIENMVQQMYNWHVRQGHFLPQVSQ